MDFSYKSISMKCKICGGDLKNDYMSGVSVCENCGNKWILTDIVPNIADYSRIIDKINRADELLAGINSSSDASRALILFKSAASECRDKHDMISSDIMKICLEGQERAVSLKAYISGKSYLEKKDYRKAFQEISKANGIMDSNSLIEECRKGAALQKKKRIPYAVAIGMIIPFILCIFLKEKINFPVVGCIPVFIIGSFGLGYIVYLEGVLSIIVEIISFLSAVPLLIFVIFAYGLHFSVVFSAILAIVVPVGILIFLAIIFERK